MIDLEPFIGKFEWTTLDLSCASGSYSIVVPDVMCIFRFIILCIIVRYLIKSFFTLASLLK